jgi:hypothetical protein
VSDEGGNSDRTFRTASIAVVRLGTPSSSAMAACLRVSLGADNREGIQAVSENSAIFDHYSFGKSERDAISSMSVADRIVFVKAGCASVKIS